MMKIQEGKVKYMDREDRIKYGVTDEGKQYYFLDKEDNRKLKNNSRVASTDLKEAVDPLYASEHAKNVGLIGEEGNEIIPFVNKSIRPINDDIVLVEPAEPVSQSVKDVVQLKKDDPLAANKLVPTPALIKNNINQKMGNTGRYVFNNQFSEATIVDVNGNNLVNNEYYSFIANTPDKIYFSKNTVESPIGEYSLTGNEIAPETTTNQELDVTNVNVDANVVENALTTENVNEGFAKSDIPAVDLTNEQVAENQTTDVAPIAPVDTNTVAEVAPIAPMPEEQTIDEEVTPTESVDTVAPVETNSVDEVVETPVEKVASVEVPTEEVKTEETVVETPVEDTVQETVENDSDDMVPPQIDADEESEEEVAEEQTEVDNTEEVKDEQEEIVETPVEENEVSAEEVEAAINSVQDNIVDTTTEEKEEETSVEVEDKDEEIEEATNDIDLNDDKEDTILDNMFNDVTKARNVEDDMEEDIFSTSIKTDSIDADDDYEETYDVSDFMDTKSNEDTTMKEIAESMASLIKQNKELKSSYNNVLTKFERANDSRKTAVEKARMLEKKVDVLSAKNQNLDSKIVKLESKNDILENKVREQERLIDSQRRELDRQRSKLQGAEELSKLLQDAKVVLEDDKSSYGYDSEDTYYRRAA